MGCANLGALTTWAHCAAQLPVLQVLQAVQTGSPTSADAERRKLTGGQLVISPAEPASIQATSSRLVDGGQAVPSAASQPASASCGVAGALLSTCSSRPRQTGASRRQAAAQSPAPPAMAAPNTWAQPGPAAGGAEQAARHCCPTKRPRQAPHTQCPGSRARLSSQPLTAATPTLPEESLRL